MVAFQPHLADGLQIDGGLHVAYRAADFNNADIRAGTLGHLADVALDFVGYMGNGLNGRPRELAPQFPLQQNAVNFAGGAARLAGQGGIHKAFVIAQIQVGGVTIIGNEGLAMLQRT